MNVKKRLAECKEIWKLVDYIIMDQEKLKQFEAVCVYIRINDTIE